MTKGSRRRDPAADERMSNWTGISIGYCLEITVPGSPGSRTVWARSTVKGTPANMPWQTKRTNSFRLLLALCALLCVGLACCHKASPHSVTLTWEAIPATPGVSVVGYNVYRSTTSGNQFVKIASRVPGPPYEDRLVGSGRTYFYVVTSLDQAGHESRFSGEARATIP